MHLCPKCGATNLVCIEKDAQCQFCGHEFELKAQKWSWEDEDDDE